MKTKLLLLAVSIAAFSSCTTMYKTGQTPDDVYFSPARPAGGAVAATRDEAPIEPANNYYSSQDRVIRLGITDYRYRYLDNDYGYGNSPYDFSFSYNHGGYYNSLYSNNYYSPYYSDIFYGNYYYNPYYNAYPVYVLPAGPLRNSTPRTTNLAGYGRNNYSNTNSARTLAPHPTGNYNNSNTNGRTPARSSGLGNLLNRVLAPATNNNNTTNYNNTQNNTTRTYTPPPASTTPSSSSSSGGSSSGSSSGTISRPH